MRETTTDLWTDLRTPGHRIGITTNGFVKRNGEAVMGRGCAYEAARMFPDIPKHLGAYITRQGNMPGYLMLEPGSGTADRLIILPVKDAWWMDATRELIARSTRWLLVEAAQCPDWTFHVPRLGCGNGGLDWVQDVEPFMRTLPDNVMVHHGRNGGRRRNEHSSVGPSHA
jgi:hypothetical protein